MNPTEDQDSGHPRIADDHGFSCPSARCETGAHLFGIVGSDGLVGYISPPLPVTEAFVEQVRGDRHPESRFRFTNTCAEQGCRHWTGSRCEVVDTALIALREQALPRIRPCAIRHSCRWFHQVGRSACEVCPLVITDGEG